MNLATDTLVLRVGGVRAEAKDIISLEFTSPSGADLPPFTSGSHLELHLRNGQIRHYSLLNDPTERHRYVVAVSLAAESRGGSRFIHGSLRQGDTLTVVGPRNNFALDERAERFCFVAGGIGITPILSMLRWCIRNGKDWRLVYAARNRARAAFYEELRALDPERVQFHFNDEQDGRYLAVDDLVSSLGDDEHLYCCGPDPLMQAVQQAGTAVAERLHFEWFSPPELPTQEASDDQGFEVVLRRSGRTLRVAEDQSILDALEANGIEAPFSCRAGICRTCETSVCGGLPEHRDYVLSDEERAANDCMMICVSRARTASLELDL
ncbi:2Fe-2S iron-sulfur cluster binding domain-containing protein [Pseudomonas stutzeri]|uniref:Flavodoxin n=1 Tax=Stutzerimonas stutzeri KOS6 TaxID=1218352 RepID=A0A061JRU4_STUST|nr:PDR/VanB family oxidoreductase [Stutzerimonas stutzeri]EWC42456.1 flavodoxin [Stutzerimonas stutzeri KOS6]MBK3870211.1 2Fe-2S iron-sulfur cluster binding domain-containing protein [Stutzerimonas stutzeri]